MNDYEHNRPLNSDIYEAIKPIYEELTKDELLYRCLGGYTQNNNASFNAALWSMSPKSVSSGLKVLTICSDLAVCILSDELLSVINVMKVLGITIGENCYNFCIEADQTRIDYSERSLTEEARAARMSLKSSRKAEEHENSNLQGQLYGAGIAD